MKNRFLRKLKIFLCLILIFFIAITIVVTIKYNNNPLGFQTELEEFTEQITEYVYKINGIKSGNQTDIIFPEKEDLSGAQRYFYYEQLSDTAKIIYLTIENNIDKLIDGEDNIKLPSSLNEFAKNNGKEKVAQEFQNAWDAFTTDKCEYFYIDSSKVCLVSKITTIATTTNYEFSIGKGDNVNYFINEFDSKEQVQEAIKEIEVVEKEILEKAKGNNYEKMLYIHDYIVNNTKYESYENQNTSNIYGCLVNNIAICEGYARSYKYLLDKLEIPCVLVSGEAIDENGNSERHAWNYVFINNNWYAVDVTWDDPIIIGNGKITDNIKYRYFLKGKNTMQKDHTTLGRITKDGMEFQYPVLALDDL